MTGLPPLNWDLSYDPDKIVNEPLQAQEEIIRQVKDYGERTAAGIYGSYNRFTPTAEGSGTAGTGTYDVQKGWYQRFGKMIFFTMDLQWDDSNHTGTGDLIIKGLPAPSYDKASIDTLVNVYNSESGSEWVGLGIIGSDTKSITPIKNGATSVQIDGADYQLNITGLYRVK